MPDLSAFDLGQFEVTLVEDVFYDHSPNCRGPLRDLKKNSRTPNPPRPSIRYPDNARSDLFLAHLQCKQPLSVERVLAYPANDIIRGLNWDFTSRWVGDFRLRRNFHRILSLFLTKEHFETTELQYHEPADGLDERLRGFFDDRHLKQSLLLRTHFSLRQIAVGDDTPFEDRLCTQLYKGIFDEDYRSWGRSHLRYRDGPRRPDLLLVARSRLQSTSVLAECPLEMAAWPSMGYDEADRLYEAYDEALWNSLEGQEKLDACETVLRSEYEDIEDKDAFRQRWLEQGEVVSARCHRC